MASVFLFLHFSLQGSLCTCRAENHHRGATLHIEINMTETYGSSPPVTPVENATRVKVGTETQGEAFVEYAVTISFMVHSIEHTIELTAYATTCKIMVQSIGEKPDPNNKCLPRFFVETILLPWCESSCKNGVNNDY